MDPRVDEVIAFWFGLELAPSPAIFRRWFTRDPAFDAEVRRKFDHLVEAAGTLDWQGEARSELALIVVVDQFPRNIYRDDPRAFARDPLALSVARELLLSDRARLLGVHQRMVALLPFQHAEDRDAQLEGLAAFAALVEDARKQSASGLEMLESALDYAKKHAAIIERFGHFPHRNTVLGRSSTPDELAFLAQPGSRF